MTDVQTEAPPRRSLAANEARPSARRFPSSAAAAGNRWTLVLWTLLAAAFLTVAIVRAIESAVHFGGVPIDGPFQLYDALRRIAAGFRPGIDFQFFHGLGMPYLYYGFFRLFGGTFRASEITRSLISPIAFAIVLVVTLRTFTGGWTRTVCLMVMGLAITFTTPVYGVYAALIFAVNGMLGVRSMLATLVPVALFLARTRRQRIVAGGAALGLALLFSTEQGMAVTAAYVVISFVAALRRDRKTQIAEAVMTIALAVTTLMLGLLVIAGPRGALGALRYNFATVPGDQYWFFGAPPNVFLPSWSAAAWMTRGLWPVGFALTLGAIATIGYIIRFCIAPDGDEGRRNFALAVLPTYGLLSCGSLLGVFTSVYTQPCWRTLLLVALIEWSRLGDRVVAQDARARVLGEPRIVALGALAFTVLSVVTTPLVRFTLSGSLPHVVRDDMFGHARFAATPMWIDALDVGQHVIDSHRGPHGEPPTLWSTYSGWIEAKNGLFNPSFDYMIHALGEQNRRDYVDRFKTARPTLVQTVRPSYTAYERWLENTMWPFYGELLRWYDVADTTGWSLYWERRATPTPPPALVATLQIPPGDTTLTLPPIPASLTSQVMVLEVELEYETRNPLHWLPVVGRVPRYLVDIRGAASTVPVSLDPFTRRERFPIVVERGQRPTLRFHTASLLPGARYVARSARVSVVAVAPANERWLAELVERGP